MQCGWSRLMRGLQKVMHLAIFLRPPRGGEEGTVRVSMWECAARLGTLNSRIPSLSNVAWESTIWGEWHPQTHRNMGYGLGNAMWLTSAMKWPRKGFGVPSWEILVWDVGLRVPGLGYLDSLIL